VVVAGAVVGSAGLMLVSGVQHLDPQRAVFEAMLAGWTRQQQARLLADQTITAKVQAVRRFAEFTNDYPWVWTPADAEEFWAELRSAGFGRATLRSYQVRLRLFGDFVTDPRYGWAEECWQRFGAHPVQVCTESNTAAHAAEYEGSPRRRPFTREELQALFDHADAQVGRAVADGRKGAVAAFRDAVALKVVYAWGLRRREAAMLDVTDWYPNPAARELGRFGALHVRYGKAMRGSPPRRRTVLSVFPWAVEAVQQYLESVRPLLAGPKDPVMWPTERGSRLSTRALNDRMASYRAAIGLAEELDLHALRHSYVTHLIEDGLPERFVSEQVGHAYAATTALYTNVSDDFKNRTLTKALGRAFTAPAVGGGA
jgi:integrase/recombinase XerC